MSRATLPAQYSPKEHRLDMLRSELFREVLRTLPEKAASALDPQTCAEDMLNTLAIHYTTDFWDTDLTAADKRALLQKTLLLKQTKGTEYAMRLALSALNLADADIVEGADITRRDGTYSYNGIKKHGSLEWWRYTIFIAQPMLWARSLMVKNLLMAYAPARSSLTELVFQQLHARNGSIQYDATYTHGTIGG